MKILLVNKFLYPKGGAETYTFQLGALLQKNGHQVQYFGLEHPRNTVGNNAGIYVRHQDFGQGIQKNLSAPLRILYSAEARRKMKLVLEAFRPDVVHLNNIQFHLTPSIILAVADYRREQGRSVKLVYTAHDYQLICPSHGLFDGQLQICKKCLSGNYIHCIKGKCLKNSRLKSLLAALDACLWKRSKAYSYLDTIVCPSQFLKSKLDTQPRFREKTVVLHNFVDISRRKTPEAGSYVLEFGHLSRDKGTYTLLDAAKRMPETRFLFAGFGEAAADMAGLPNATYLGFQTGEALRDLVAKAAVTVCPSEMYENCPYSVIESQLMGTPVLGSRMGGIPELIREGETGELFEAGNARDLEGKLRLMLVELDRYTQGCGSYADQTPETYYQNIIKIYGE